MMTGGPETVELLPLAPQSAAGGRPNLARKMFASMQRSTITGKAAKFKRIKYPKAKIALTRQTIRSAMRAKAFGEVTKLNPAMPRNECRKLSRAYAAAAFKLGATK